MSTETLTRVNILYKHRKLGPLGQIRGNWQCRRQMPWGDGILECWNNGFLRMRSFLDTFSKSEIIIKTISVFYTRYSIIPPFHSTSKGKLHPSAVKSKPGPPGPDSLLTTRYDIDVLPHSRLNRVFGRPTDFRSGNSIIIRRRIRRQGAPLGCQRDR